MLGEFSNTEVIKELLKEITVVDNKTLDSFTLDWKTEMLLFLHDDLFLLNNQLKTVT